jgi:hypothetical protein
VRLRFAFEGWRDQAALRRHRRDAAAAFAGRASRRMLGAAFAGWRERAAAIAVAHASSEIMAIRRDQALQVMQQTGTLFRPSSMRLQVRLTDVGAHVIGSRAAKAPKKLQHA